MTFQYEILVPRSNPAVPSGYIWYLGSRMTPAPGSPDLIRVLNTLGQQGWEVVTIGNLGFDMASEILLKKQTT